MDLGLFHLMEDFILNEVDSDIQTSSRAKRRMRRNLNKELAPYLNEDEQTQSLDDSYEESFEEYESPRKKYKYDVQPNFIERHVDICLGIAYICILFTFYGTTIYLVQNYSKCIP
jgi:hypothetical protein